MIKFWDGTGVTAEELDDEVRRLALQFPDNKKSCMYTVHEYDGDTCNITSAVPECIVGQAIFNLTGKPVGGLFAAGSLMASPYWLNAFGFTTGPGTSDAYYHAWKVQYYQDNGRPWGQALREADENSAPYRF